MTDVTKMRMLFVFLKSGVDLISLSCYFNKITYSNDVKLTIDAPCLYKAQ